MNDLVVVAGGKPIVALNGIDAAVAVLKSLPKDYDVVVQRQAC